MNEYLLHNDYKNEKQKEEVCYPGNDLSRDKTGFVFLCILLKGHNILALLLVSAILFTPIMRRCSSLSNYYVMEMNENWLKWRKRGQNYN